MAGTPKTNPLTTSDLWLLAYARYMAETAQSNDAKNMFTLYVKKEKERMEKMGMGQLQLDG